MLALVFALLSSSVGRPVVVRAQGGTPDPAECRVEPRSVASIRQIIAALPPKVPTEGALRPGDMVEVGGGGRRRRRM